MVRPLRMRTTQSARSTAAPAATTHSRGIKRYAPALALAVRLLAVRLLVVRLLVVRPLVVLDAVIGLANLR